MGVAGGHLLPYGKVNQRGDRSVDVAAVAQLSRGVVSPAPKQPKLTYSAGVSVAARKFGRVAASDNVRVRTATFNIYSPNSYEVCRAAGESGDGCVCV